eukprot:CAMPEP_0206027762 /NCGR_PEP_ID=MMETSP1464-20131121/43805_1 /ASSEMBLY_ACC=CAM_ASM_001124 /TAXON_ID=119497 /ORGANISM="Exanthemachrysis gayraliae, Strain RCC1523" /LENGTH=272 /DNA_ID=CAMNT_0053401807 /DNA_START=253 /DNA_END=1067 /DNA_ORIENTATION=-
MGSSSSWSKSHAIVCVGACGGERLDAGAAPRAGPLPAARCARRPRAGHRGLTAAATLCSEAHERAQLGLGVLHHGGDHRRVEVPHHRLLDVPVHARHGVPGGHRMHGEEPRAPDRVKHPHQLEDRKLGALVRRGLRGPEDGLGEEHLGGHGAHLREPVLPQREGHRRAAPRGPRLHRDGDGRARAERLHLLGGLVQGAHEGLRGHVGRRLRRGPPRRGRARACGRARHARPAEARHQRVRVHREGLALVAQKVPGHEAHEVALVVVAQERRG